MKKWVKKQIWNNKFPFTLKHFTQIIKTSSDIWPRLKNSWNRIIAYCHNSTVFLVSILESIQYSYLLIDSRTSSFVICLSISFETFELSIIICCLFFSLLTFSLRKILIDRRIAFIFAPSNAVLRLAIHFYVSQPYTWNFWHCRYLLDVWRYEDQYDIIWIVALWWPNLWDAWLMMVLVSCLTMQSF